MEVYEPREDSLLLKEVMKDYAKGKCLDMGTGSGILAEEAARFCDSVLAVDINKNAIKYCKRNIKNPRIEFRVSDLFSNVKESFDTILFNPPFLPGKSGERAVDGGKDGCEIIERFFKVAMNHLKGQILMVFSSLTNKARVNEILKKYNYRFEEIASKPIFFEKLYVYRVVR